MIKLKQNYYLLHKIIKILIIMFNLVINFNYYKLKEKRLNNNNIKYKFNHNYKIINKI